MKTERIRLLFVMGHLGVNGATKSLLALLTALPKELYDISLFVCLQDNQDILDALPVGVKLLPPVLEYEIHRLPLRDAVDKAFKLRRWDMIWFRLRIALARFLKRGNYPCWDVLPEIKGPLDFAIAYADGWLASMVVKKVVGCKKILWVHENYEDAPKSQEVLNSFCEADGIVGVSFDSIRHLTKILGTAINGKTYVVHNIVDPCEVRSASQHMLTSLSESTYNLISVGRVSFEKGVDLIPLILEKLCRQGNDVDWTVVGNGLESYRNKIIADAKQRGVDSRLHFVGAKDNPHPYTAKADCLVQLSRHEGWCMTISEALALGKPVVVSDLPVFHEQVFEGENGYFAHDVDSFVEAISRVLTYGVKSSEHRLLPCAPEHVKAEFYEAIKSVG